MRHTPAVIAALVLAPLAAHATEVPCEICGALPAFGYWGSGTNLETLRYVWRDRAQQKSWLGPLDKHRDQLIKLAEARLPKTVKDFVQDGDSYFFREDNIYVAIRVLKPKHALC
jgi:hypothetical protein